MLSELSAILFAAGIAAQLGASAANTVITSPIVSYAYVDTSVTKGTESSIVSYQYTAKLSGRDAASTPVSYRFYDWPGSSILYLVTAPQVSYLNQSGPPGI